MIMHESTNLSENRVASCEKNHLWGESIESIVNTDARFAMVDSPFQCGRSFPKPGFPHRKRLPQDRG
jgi:hypothetical protein